MRLYIVLQLFTSRCGATVLVFIFHAAFFLVGLPCDTVCLAATFAVGGTTISVPTPPGFAPVTPEMRAVYEYLHRLDSSEYDVLIDFIVEGQVPVALRNEPVDTTRLSRAMTIRALETRTLTPAMFAALKKEMLARLGSPAFLRPDLREKLAALTGIPNRSGKSLFGGSELRVIPLAAHWDTERGFATSVFARLSVGPKTRVTVTTTSLLLVRGKVLQIMTSGTETDLHWTRTRQKDWAEAIFAVNNADPPSTPGTSVFTWEGWDKILGLSVIIGVVTLYSTISEWRRRRRLAEAHGHRPV